MATKRSRSDGADDDNDDEDGDGYDDEDDLLRQFSASADETPKAANSSASIQQQLLLHPLERVVDSLSGIALLFTLEFIGPLNKVIDDLRLGTGPGSLVLR